MKFRIKQVYCKYYPQQKYPYWPFWMYIRWAKKIIAPTECFFKTSAQVFDTMEAAKTFLDHYSKWKRSNESVVKLIKYD